MLLTAILTSLIAANKGDTVTFKPTVPISFTSSVKVYTGYSGSITLNGGSPVAVPGVVQWTEVAIGSGTINTLATTGDDKNVVWYALDDGKLLVNQGLVDPNAARVVSKDTNTITVDGGTWTTSDKLVNETPYDTKLTLDGSNRPCRDVNSETFGTDGIGFTATVQPNALH